MLSWPSNSSFQVYNALGVTYTRDGKVEKGIAQFETAVKLQPGYVTAWNNLGDAYEKTNDMKSALKAFEEVLLFDPNNKVARPRRDALKEKVDMYRGVPVKSMKKKWICVVDVGWFVSPSLLWSEIFACVFMQMCRDEYWLWLAIYHFSRGNGIVVSQRWSSWTSKRPHSRDNIFWMESFKNDLIVVIIYMYLYSYVSMIAFTICFI